jgi:serine/threonine protein kinase
MLKIVGNYELTLKLGSGSYAQVYKCMHSKTKDIYAIKAISKGKISLHISVLRYTIIYYYLFIKKTN